jgi:sugar lactone lactonase YvrE
MRALILLVTAFVSGCGGGERAPAADTTTAAPPAGPERVATADGFSTPESVTYDPEQRVWFVSNINGSPSARDGNGFISRMTSVGVVDSLHFIQGGRGGVRLDAPKGLAITGDTLWVTDINVLRGFNRMTGAPVATIEFGRRALFLNDITATPDSSLFLTDTGIIIADSMTHPGPDRIFRVKGRTISVTAEGAHLQGPNGIVWDPGEGGRLIMVPFGGTTIFTGKEGSGAIPMGVGPGQHDGVVVLDGRILVSSWADSSITEIGTTGNTRVITGVPAPADMGLDASGRRLAIPLFTENRVEIWKLP